MNKIIQIGNLHKSKIDNPQLGRVYSINGIAAALLTFQGGGREPHILVLYDGSKNIKVPEDTVHKTNQEVV